MNNNNNIIVSYKTHYDINLQLTVFSEIPSVYGIKWQNDNCRLARVNYGRLAGRASMNGARMVGAVSVAPVGRSVIVERRVGFGGLHIIITLWCAPTSRNVVSGPAIGRFLEKVGRSCACARMADDGVRIILAYKSTNYYYTEY